MTENPFKTKYTIDITRNISIPSDIKLARFKRSPDLGPSILFFSGGSALRGVAKKIIEYTHNTVHIMTSFDSGGSSAEIRKAFRMLSVGDLRARMMDLADTSVLGNPEIYKLFSHRFQKDDPCEKLRLQLKQLSLGTHDLIKNIEQPLKDIIQAHFDYFIRSMPQDFNLGGASLGNLILTGGFINNNRKIEPVLFLFSKLVEVRGTVCAVTDSDYHLAAIYEDETTVTGQKHITGKEVTPVGKKIQRVFISGHPYEPREVKVTAAPSVIKKINDAELIIYSYGSFYSSLIANLLPDGISPAIAAAQCPKVYIPNPQGDPESFGLRPLETAKILLSYLTDFENVIATSVLNIILLDINTPEDPEMELFFHRLGIQTVRIPLVSEKSAPFYDATLITEAILSMS
ncbi:GAK system CofD-like protein [Myxococcota bacterium]|nr:GAK system CofD-like protein [Myxococcota bacterium]MBU1381352.1 GAK system CofD-like protein [Myxococcota bacterium]MBU1495974.1 GAK system CofD-like protein [Myxococcota bacterium]